MKSVGERGEIWRRRLEGVEAEASRFG